MEDKVSSPCTSLCVTKCGDYDSYTCGACYKTFGTICMLHVHLDSHGFGGSYYYSQQTRTAFPKFDSICAASQTDPNKVYNSDAFPRFDSVCTASQTDFDDVYYPDEALDKRDDQYEDKFQIVKVEVVEPEDTEILSVIKENEHVFDNYFLRMNSCAEEAIKGNSAIESSMTEQEKGIEYDGYMQTPQLNGDDEIDHMRDGSMHDQARISPVTVRKGKRKRKIRKFDQYGYENFKTVSSDKETENEDVKTLSNSIIVDMQDKNWNNDDDSLPDFTEIWSYDPSSEQISVKPANDKPELKSDVGEKKSVKHSHLQCEFCTEVFTTKAKYRKHMKGHTGKKMTYITCPECNETVAKSDMKKHPCFRRRYECEYCGKSYASEQYYKYHVKIHNGITKDYQCDLCGKMFYKQCYLNIHKGTCGVPLEDRRASFQCPICGECLASSRSLRKHKQYVHANHQTVCEICGHSYKHLKLHMRIHQEEPQFKCDVCSETFRQTSSLTRHKKLHSKRTTHQCTYCGKSFYSSWNLKAHMRNHTSEKPYTCPVCGMSFKHNVSRKAHMAKHKN